MFWWKENFQRFLRPRSQFSTLLQWPIIGTNMMVKMSAINIKVFMINPSHAMKRPEVEKSWNLDEIWR
jgi:hypothetical protein